VPLFQEQLMQIAIDVAGFTASEADQLRQAMGSKRSVERMERLRSRFYAGMAANEITGEVADAIWEKLVAFANYGFPESHSVSFGYLVYASSWIKRWYPAAFCAALLNAQPMGFYSPHSLVQDARRHGVEVRTPDLNASAATATLEGDVGTSKAERGAPPDRWGVDGPAVRLGIGSVRGVGEELAERIAVGRPYADMEDFQRRIAPTLPVLEALATAGAFGCFGLDRRAALWAAGAVAQSKPDRLPGVVTGVEAPTLPLMTPLEEARSDLWSTGVAPTGHPTRFVRADLDRRGAVTVARLDDLADGDKVWVGGVVTHRQRPATASGITFLNLEDETGMVNVVCSKGCWSRYRVAARSAPALLVRGKLEKAEGAINVVAEVLEPLPIGVPAKSRDFR
jgi:error-prone DNA polymerase